MSLSVFTLLNFLQTVLMLVSQDITLNQRGAFGVSAPNAPLTKVAL